MNNDIFTELPFNVKENLFLLAKKLPESKRSEFLSGVNQDLTEFAKEFLKDNKWTLVYGAIGFALGVALDQILEINIPFYKTISITFGWAKWIGLCGGAIHGFKKDRETERVRRIVLEQLSRFQSSC